MDALKQLSNYKDLNNIPHILVGTLVADLVAVLLAKHTDLLGHTLKRWYDEFQLSAVIADVLIIVLGILIAQVVYTEFFQGSHPLVFLLLVVVIQVIHDSLFYMGVILPVPVGQNRIIDMFKQYAREGSANIIVGDAVLMVGSTMIAAASLKLSNPLFAFLGILAVYVVPYAIA